MELNITLHVDDEGGGFVRASEQDIDAILEADDGERKLLLRLMNGLEVYTLYFKKMAALVYMPRRDEVVNYIAGVLAAHLFDIKKTDIDGKQIGQLGGVIRQAVDTYKQYFADGSGA